MKENKVVYLVFGLARETYRAVQAGEAPRERLMGAVQLIERGWPVTFCDAQWEGCAAPVRQKLARWVEIPALKTCLALWKADIAVIQGRLPPLLFLLSKVFGTRVVFVDVMFDMPKHWFKRWVNKFCLRGSDAVISYSAIQSDAWIKEYGIPIKKMMSAHYPMDSTFYKKPVVESLSTPYVIAVGRDVGRDFSTLLRASKIVDIDVKIVTLPYLLPQSWSESGRIEVFQRLSYPELFNLYAQSKLTVVPLKSEVAYPSGTRALLEAMLLRTPVVAAYTNVFAEDFKDGEHLLYVEPGSPTQLAEAINRLLDDPGLAERLVENAWQKVNSDFGVDQFADVVEKTLVRLSRSA